MLPALSRRPLASIIPLIVLRKARWHTSDSTIQRAFKQTIERVEVRKHASVHCLRHSFATHLQAVRTVRSPFDGL